MQCRDGRRLLMEAGLESAEAIDGRQASETDFGQDQPGAAVSQHVHAIGGQRQFEEAAGKAGVRLDDGVDRPRGHLEPGEGPPQHAQDLANEPVLPMRQERRITGQHG